MLEKEQNDLVGFLAEDEIEIFIRRAGEVENKTEMIGDVLRAVQKNHGWVPDEGIDLTATILDVAVVEVEDILTRDQHIFRAPVGRFPIYICDSSYCRSRGGEGIIQYLQLKLGIEMGQTTSDQLFSLLPSRCLGGCGRAPGVIIDRRFYGFLDVEEVDRLIEQLRQKVLE